MRESAKRKVATQPSLPCKIGKIWIHDLSDVLQEYLDTLKVWSSDHEGVGYMPVGSCVVDSGNYIVLEHRRQHRHRYIGWFYVSATKLANTGAWTFKAKKCGFYIHQITADDKPGGPRRRNSK